MGGDQFRRRVLLVDSDTAFIEACSNELRRRGYEILSANDGFAALQVLRGAQPDVLVAELNLPRMSGFELLSVVRTRFPAISVIALSNEYTAATLPNEAICDAFLEKSPNTAFKLVGKVETLVSESPVRGSRAKLDFAPVWIPRSTVGYLILTCPACLRSFSVTEPKASPAMETCIFCGSHVHFQMSPVEVELVPPAESAVIRALHVRGQARDVVARSQKLGGRNRPDTTQRQGASAQVVAVIKTEIRTARMFLGVALNSNDKNKAARNLANRRKPMKLRERGQRK